jgi:Transposase IS4
MIKASSSSQLQHPLESTEVFSDSEYEEYIPLLTPHQHFLNHPGLDNEEEDDDDESDSKKGRKQSKKVHKLPPPPSNFEPLVHSKQLHRAFVNLPPNYEVGFEKPINLFFLFFTNILLDKIALNTNSYALIKGAGLTGRQWKDVDRKELITWIALVVYQGVFRLPSLDQYWNGDPKLPIHHISKQMPLKRFEQIKRYLHISSPAVVVNHYFEKLEPLLSHIRDVSKQLYTPASNVSVDEMMVRFSGKSVHTIRIKNKPIPEGFKILSLCESGYTFTFLPTSRVSPSDVEKVNGLNQTGCLVHHLVTQLPYHRFSYNIYMDNYFSNVPLFQNLCQIGIGACGTVRKTASGFPKELKVDKNLRLDWDVRSGVVVNGVLAIFWQDNGPVTMLSTIHGLVGEQWEIERERRRPRETSTNATKVRAVFGSQPKKKLRIPKIIDDYNHYMNGVDIADQLRSYYCTQQTVRRNWMPLFFWLLDTAIINAYRIARTFGSTQEQKDFRLELVWDLINIANNVQEMQLRNGSKKK